MMSPATIETRLLLIVLAACLACSAPSEVDAERAGAGGDEPTVARLHSAPPEFTRQLAGVYRVESYTENTADCSGPGEAAEAATPYVAVQYIGGDRFSAQLRLWGCTDEAVCLEWAADPWNQKWHTAPTTRRPLRSVYQTYMGTTVLGSEGKAGAWDAATQRCTNMEYTAHELNVDATGRLSVRRMTHRFDGPLVEGEPSGATCSTGRAAEWGAASPCLQLMTLEAARVATVPACAIVDCTVQP